MHLSQKIGIGAAFALVVTAPVPGRAQSTPQIQALQEQIRRLQEQLSTLQRQVDQTQAQMRRAQEEARAAPKPAPTPPAVAAAPAPAPAVHATLSAGNRPGIASADGRNTIQLTSRLQFDAGDYLKVSPQGTGSPHSLTSGVNARRARIGIIGKFLDDWHYTLIYDLGGTADSFTGSGSAASGIENAFLSYTGLHPFAIEGGYMDVPYALDETTSSNDIMFLERPSPVAVATGLGAGDFRSAFGVRANGERWWAGAYVTGPIAGAAHTGSNQQQIGGVARVTYQILQDKNYSLHFGVDGQHVFAPRSSSAPITKTLTLSDRPELRVDPTTILTTGPIAADNASVYGVEVAGGYHSLFFQGEYFHYVVDQYPSAALNGGLTPTLNFDGGYAEASWTITGESRKYNPETGAYTAIIPDHPVSFADGGWGAWELGVRFSQIDLNDHVTPGTLQTATGGVFGGLQRVYTLGLNWYVNRNIRFMFDYIHADVDKLAGTTVGTPPVGARIDALAMRTQVAF